MRRCALPWPNLKSTSWAGRWSAYPQGLDGYNYISVGKDGFLLISVKLAVGVTRLAHDL
jgi:hypothetical protein